MAGTKRKKAKAKKKKQSNRSIADARIEKYYNKIVFGFIGVTAVLIIVILYFSFSKTEIIITPNTTSTELSLQASVDELGGTVLITDVEGSKTGNASGETKEVIGRSSGTATIINNSSSSQPLVATTRLLSEGGVLFRTQERVTVPANGSVDVLVAADEDGEQGDIGPTTFEIVALNESSKEFIYAESSENMTGGRAEVGVVSQTDIANTQEELEAELLEQARTTFEDEIANREGIAENPLLAQEAYVLSTNSEEVDVQAGDEVDSFTATQSITVAAVVVDMDTLQTYVDAKLAEQVPEGSELVNEPEANSVTLVVDEVNDDNTGTVSVTLPVQTTIDLTNELLDPEKLTNKTAEEVQDYLGTFEEVESVELKFSPFWVRTTPGIANNISITVN